MARRARRILAPLAMLLGLLLFGTSLLQLNSQANPRQEVQLNPGSLALANGTAVLLYPIDYFGFWTDRIEVAYSFPDAAGDAYVIGCEDTAALLGGDPAASPFMRFNGLREGSFVITRQTLPPLSHFYSVDQASRVPCDPAVAFVWATDDPTQNRPDASVLYYEAGLVGEEFFWLSLLMGSSALLTLAGGLSWVRTTHLASAPTEGSTVEALRASLDQVVVQLERTRKHLLFAGVLGIFLWYPFLIPWSWQKAMEASGHAGTAFGVAAFTLAFLVALTILWAREFVRLDRHLAAWRSRLGQLRLREEGLMESLEQGG